MQQLCQQAAATITSYTSCCLGLTGCMRMGDGLHLTFDICCWSSITDKVSLRCTGAIVTCNLPPALLLCPTAVCRMAGLPVACHFQMLAVKLQLTLWVLHYATSHPEDHKESKPPAFPLLLTGQPTAESCQSRTHVCQEGDTHHSSTEGGAQDGALEP